MSGSKRMHGVIRLGQLGQKLVERDGGIRIKLGPLKGWNTYRVTPSLPKQSFRDRWSTIQKETHKEGMQLDPALKARMEAFVAQRNQGGGSSNGGHA
jgi:L-lactate dehydrogenase complex protein LldF